MSDAGRVAAAWRDDGAGERYATRRFAGSRSAGRDPRLVARALARHGVERGRGGILDVPCGAGRLTDVLARHGEPVTGADLSPSMLAEAGGARRVLASAFALPFAAASFDVVVCCRLLHHLREPGDLERVAGELLRVSARLVIASFWDATSLPALRRRVGLKRPEARVAIPHERMARVFERAGARVLGFEHSLRFVSQQTFLVVRREPA
jgi:SAM-dependent methyltransferase